MVVRVLLLMTLLSPTAQQQAPGSCSHCAAPIHSWEHLPVAFHSSEIATNSLGEFSAAELETIVKFPLVTIEKFVQCLSLRVGIPPGDVFSLSVSNTPKYMPVVETVYLQNCKQVAG